MPGMARAKDLPGEEDPSRNHTGDIAGVPHAHLPPNGVILVYNLEQVPGVEAQACLLAGDETVAGGVIIEVAFNKYLSPGIWKESPVMNGEHSRPLSLED